MSCKGKLDWFNSKSNPLRFQRVSPSKPLHVPLISKGILYKFPSLPLAVRATSPSPSLQFSLVFKGNRFQSCLKFPLIPKEIHPNIHSTAKTIPLDIRGNHPSGSFHVPFGFNGNPLQIPFKSKSNPLGSPLKSKGTWRDVEGDVGRIAFGILHIGIILELNGFWREAFKFEWIQCVLYGMLKRSPSNCK